MTDIIPAWAEEFFAGGPGPAPRLNFPRQLTRPWAYGDRSGRGVTVAVIDSGVEHAHPMVGDVQRAIAVEDAGGDDVEFVEGPHDDLYGHGTACGGIIRGLAPAVDLISVRVLGSDLKGSAFTFAHGLQWCIEHDVDIVNLSLSTSNEDYAETFYDLVDFAIQRNVMVVSAMNNERKRSIPSEFAGVFSVACCEGRDREHFLCNPNPPAEWGAIGIDVEVPWSGGATIVATGNSFAAPVIAGHLARIVATHPGITVWQAKTVLAALAVNSESRVGVAATSTGRSAPASGGQRRR
jgi:subtilisin family serine protease